MRPALVKQNYNIISIKAICLRHLLIEFYTAQACCYGNIETDKRCAWIGIVSVFKIYFDIIETLYSWYYLPSPKWLKSTHR